MNRATEYTYLKSKTDNFVPFAKQRIKILEKYLLSIKPKKILELGCGEGSLALLIKNLTNAQVYGTDLSQSGVNLSKEKGIMAKKADLNKKIPFENNSFDLLVSDQLLEHMFNTDQFLQECYRVLKKGGYLITITPNLSYWLNRILFVFGIYPIFLEVSTKNKTFGQGFIKKVMKEKEPMGHIRVFNLPALTEILESENFHVLEKKGIPLSFNMSFFAKIFYNFFDELFALKPSLARDLMVIAMKV